MRRWVPLSPIEGSGVVITQSILDHDEYSLFGSLSEPESQTATAAAPATPPASAIASEHMKQSQYVFQGGREFERVGLRHPLVYVGSYTI